TPGLPSVHLRTPSVHLRPSSVHLRPSSVHLRPSSVHLRTPSMHLRPLSVHPRSPARGLRPCPRHRRHCECERRASGTHVGLVPGAVKASARSEPVRLGESHSNSYDAFYIDCDVKKQQSLRKEPYFMICNAF